MTEVLRKWSPKESELVLLDSFLSIMIIYPCEKDGFKPKVSKESSISSWMPECIYHPSDFRYYIEFFFQKAMSVIHIQYHVFVIRASFIRWWPPSLKKFKLPIFNKLFDLILLFLRLPIIPKCKEFHFSICKLSSGVLTQLLNSPREDQVYSPRLGPNEIFINRLEPAHIIMSMRNHVDCKMLMLVGSSNYRLHRRLGSFSVFLPRLLRRFRR